MSAPSNSDDIIDSRDVIARIEELEAERDAAQEESEAALIAWLEADGDELTALKALAEEASGYAADWRHGESLVRDSYFEDYARQLAEDIGAINAEATWPNNCIDWKEAAKELQMDYTSVDFDGITYWTR